MRKRIFALVVLILLAVASVSFAATTAYQKTNLTGGGATALDGINGSVLVDGDFAFVMASGNFYVYLLDADSGASASSPDVIAPTTNPGNKRWLLQAVYGAGGLSGGTQYYLPIWTASDTLGKVASLGSAGNPLISGGAGANPSFLSGLVLAGGTNTFSLTNGTASLSVAAGKVVNFSGTFTDGKLCTYTASGNVIACNSTAAGTGDFLADGTVPMTGAIVPNSAGGQTIGSATYPFGSIFIGNAGTNNITLTGTAASAKTVTLPGQTGTVTVGPTTTTAGQAFIGTSTAGLGAWTTGVLSLGTNLTTQTGAVTLTGAGGGSTLTLPTAISLAGTLTNGKLCSFNSSGNVISCNVDPSGGTPTIITVADTTAASTYVALFEAATGDIGPKTDAGLTYNASTGMLTATGLSGPLTGTASGNIANSVIAAAGDVVVGSGAGAATVITKGANNSLFGVSSAGTLGFYTTITLDDSAAQFKHADTTAALKLSMDGATAGKTMTITSAHTNDRAVTMADAAGKIQVAPANTTADKIALGTTTDGLLAWSTNTIDAYATLASPSFTGTVVLPAATVGAAEVKTVMKTEGATVLVGDTTAPVATGTHWYTAFMVPFKATLTSITLTTNQSTGTCTIDVFKGQLGSTTGLAALSVSNSIFTSSTKPALTADDKNVTVSTFDSGEDAVTANDWFVIAVDANDTLTQFMVGFTFTRAD